MDAQSKLQHLTEYGRKIHAVVREFGLGLINCSHLSYICDKKNNFFTDKRDGTIARAMD